MKKILVIGSLNMDFVAGVSHIPTIGETILLQECGLEKDLRTNAELLQRKGVKNIVVTLGGEGSYILKEDHTEKNCMLIGQSMW